MTEIVARIPRPRALAPTLVLLAAVAALATVGAVVLHFRPGAPARTHVRPRPRPRPLPILPAPSAPTAPAPAPLEALPTEAIDANAARAFDRSFFFSARRGVFAAARNVAVWRKDALRAAEGTTIDARLLESLIYVESDGAAGAVSGNRAGLTQLTPAQARSVGLHVNTRASARLTREIGWWVHHGNYREARQLARARARADRRFSALAELRATVRYLEGAQRSLGRLDLAVSSLHLGVSGLRGTIARFGRRDVSYGQLYFGSAPDRRPVVYRRLTAHGEAAYDYWWHVLAAQRVLGLYFGHPQKLAWEDQQQHRKNSAEEVLHPRPVAHEFRTNAQLARAWKRGVLQWIPNAPARTGVTVEHLGGMMPRSERKLFHGLRPSALGVLFLIGQRVRQLSHESQPLHLTSAVRDDRYQAALQGVNAFAARTYSLHTTGFTFDLGRATLSSAQERSLRWVLDRLTALNAVAYIEEPYCFHVTVSSRSAHELGLLRAGV